MKKIFSFLLMAAMLLAVGASVTSCSSGDDGEEEYVPVESPYSKNSQREACASVVLYPYL